MTDGEYLALMNRIADAPDAATVAELLRLNPFTDARQLKDALSLCDTPAEANLVLGCNGALAQRVARETAMMADLNRRDPVADALVAAVKAATSPAEAAALLAEASPALYAEAAAQLTLAQYDAHELGARYHELILDEKRP
jgi:hypothetical protein